MTTPFSEELISAYLDGELSPTEKLEVERQLEYSPAAREQLKAFTELSQAMGTLTVVTAPADFRASVLAQLPEKPFVKPAPPRRYSIAWWRPIVAVCVLLGLGTLLLNRNQQRHEIASTAGDLSPQIESSVSEFEKLKQGSSTANDLSLIPGKIEAAMESPATLANHARGPVPTLTEAPSFSIINVPQVVHVNELQLKQKLESLGRHPSPGEVLSIIDNSEEVPVMVEFTVIDVMDALGKVNVLLREHKSVRSLNTLPTADQYATEQPALTAIVLELDNTLEMTAFLNKVQALDAKLYLPGEEPVVDETKPAIDPSPLPTQQELLAKQESPDKTERHQNFTFQLLSQQAVPVHQLSADEDVKEVTRPKPATHKPTEANPSTQIKENDFAKDASVNNMNVKSTLTPPAPALPEELADAAERLKAGKKVRAVLLFKKK